MHPRYHTGKKKKKKRFLKQQSLFQDEQHRVDHGTRTWASNSVSDGRITEYFTRQFTSGSGTTVLYKADIVQGNYYKKKLMLNGSDDITTSLGAL
jgi:hypothetical protein